MFISHQTWDLLRIMYYGFVGFCTDFFEKHPGYTIYPIRMNGSAVETVFSQLKYATGGNLISTNYASARSSILLRVCISGKYKGDDYNSFRTPASTQKEINNKYFTFTNAHTYCVWISYCIICTVIS